MIPMAPGFWKPAAGGDPYFEYVIFLLHFEGTDGAQVFIDEMGHTFNGNATTETDKAQAGNSSGYFTGNTTDSLSDVHSHSADYNIGTSDFTMEAYVWCISRITGARIFETNKWYWNPPTGWNVYISSTGYTTMLLSENGGGGATAAADSVLPTGQWVHYAVVKYGNTMMQFIDGTKQSATLDVTGRSVTSEDVMIGQDTDLISTPFYGYIDEARYTAVARYTADFTPPTTPFPNF